MSLCFTHPRGVYDFLLSDESYQSYIKTVLALLNVIIAVGGVSVPVQNTSNKVFGSIQIDV